MRSFEQAAKERKKKISPHTPLKEKRRENPNWENNYCDVIDTLLDECSDLICQDYRKWFAKMFQSINPNTVFRLYAEAKADGNDPRRLFSYLIKREAYK